MTRHFQVFRWPTVLLGFLVLAPLQGRAATYFVDNIAGRDTNAGLSPADAWQTIDRVNQQTFGPGDSILLKRGGAWHGSGFKAHGSGNPQAPVTLAPSLRQEQLRRALRVVLAQLARHVRLADVFDAILQRINAST